MSDSIEAKELQGAGDIPPAPLGPPGRVLSAIVGVMIGLMMLVTTADVIGRYFFNKPIYGAFQLTEVLMGLVIFAGLPLATAAREHIAVNFLENVLPTRGRCVQTALTDLICAAIAGVMAWRIWIRGTALIDAREVMQQLDINRGYVAWTMAVLLAVTAATFLYCAIVAARAAFRRAP